MLSVPRIVALRIKYLLPTLSASQPHSNRDSAVTILPATMISVRNLSSAAGEVKVGVRVWLWSGTPLLNKSKAYRVCTLGPLDDNFRRVADSGNCSFILSKKRSKEKINPLELNESINLLDLHTLDNSKSISLVICV